MHIYIYIHIYIYMHVQHIFGIVGSQQVLCLAIFFGWLQDKLISIKWGIVAQFQNHQELKIKFQRPTFNRKTLLQLFLKPRKHCF